MLNSAYQPIADYVRTYLLHTASAGDPHNGERRATARYWHTLNVCQNLDLILTGEKADAATRQLCETAALFHDIDSYTVRHADHAVRGAETATRFLTKAGYPSDFVMAVARIVREHDYDWDDEQPASEQVADMLAALSQASRMVIDADLLDKIGVSNIMAALMPMGRADKYAYEAARELTNGWPLERARFWYDLLTTKTGRALGAQRFGFYQQFLAQIKGEIVTADPFAQAAVAGV
ncbi:MAG: HD domain-containing protein [Aggregatilineales bacterium]